jgi:hypothetical protein
MHALVEVLRGICEIVAFSYRLRTTGRGIRHGAR